MKHLPSLVKSVNNSPFPTALGRNSLGRNSCGQSWWVEINTAVPLCTYYFGPFDSQKAARDSRTSYVNDLHQEEARGIVALVKQCQPDQLTIDQGYYEIQVKDNLEQ